MRKLLVGLAAAAVLASAAMGQAEKRERSEPSANQPKLPSVQDVLDSPVPEAAFQDVPLEQVMEWLADYVDTNVWVRWQVLEQSGVERDKPISIRVRDLPLRQVLWIILTEAGGPEVKLAYATMENLLIISTWSNLNEELITKVYEVPDLVARIPRFKNGVRVDAARALQPDNRGVSEGTAQSPPGDSDDPKQAVQELIAMIVETVEPDSWVVNGGLGTIKAWRRKVVVRNSLYVHQQLGGTLQKINSL